jgi:hypothetical protein
MRRFALILAAGAVSAASPVWGEAPVSYNKDVRPILSDKCFACHGPDEHARKAGLRFDKEEAATQPAKSGDYAIVPGDLDKSELVARIITADVDDRMPPADFGKTLSEAEIGVLKRWVQEGAKYEKHWSLIPPADVETPAVAHPELVKNPIDNFVLARLEQEGLGLSPEADKATLLRRVTLDLTGLPPAPGEVDAFISDPRSDAYEQLVDRLLASPAYGENLARKWLDLASYADTNGYHIDNERYMWRWRDWVIGAFNKNMPFDEFTIEQLAGDLLPDATMEQKLATGFLRNHMITFEGGIIPEEYRTQYVLDRVNTTSTVWLGLTMNCTQCHDHKYDPISQKDYYSTFAFFNSVPESGSDGIAGNSQPLMKAPLPEQQARITALDQQIGGVRGYMNRALPEIDAKQQEWETAKHAAVKSRWQTLDASAMVSTGGAALRKLEDLSVLAEGAAPDKDVYEVTATLSLGEIRALRVEALTDASLPNAGPGRADNSNFVLGEIEAEVSPAGSPEIVEKVRFIAADADYSQPKFEVAHAIDGNIETGWAVDGDKKHENRTAIFVADRPYGFGDGTLMKVRLRFDANSFNKHSIGRFRISATEDTSMSTSELGAWYAAGPYLAENGKLAYETAYEPETKIDLAETYPDQRQKWVALKNVSDGAPFDLPGGVAATYLYRTITAPTARKMTLALASNDAVKVWLNGAVVHDKNISRTLKADEDMVDIQLQQGENTLLVKVVNYGSAYQFYFKSAREDLGDIPLALEALFATAPEARTPAQQEELRRLYRRENWADWKPLETYLASLEEEQKKLDAEVPTAMIMQELPQPRETFVLARGQYDQPTEKVTPAVPAALGALPPGAPQNRLGLAQWIVSRDNPLTARVIVNRFWEHYFGAGIVKTVEDFGLQGEWPANPQLLDWLAIHFMENGWDVKAMQRMIVTSATYRQRSNSSPELNQKDPENRLLARGPRYRLEAESIRDSALAASGLLVPKIGGPSVRPYQPDLWKEVSYGGTGNSFTAQVFVQDNGENLFRRSMYTFWKRQSPPPTMLTFDAPTREVCTARRARTNTPLQALAIMNDPQFVEAARVLAQRVLKEAAPDINARIDLTCKLVLARTPRDEERAVMAEFLLGQIEAYRAAPDEAKKLIDVGDTVPDPALDPVELATWSTLASMLLNLDEAMSKT